MLSSVVLTNVVILNEVKDLLFSDLCRRGNAQF